MTAACSPESFAPSVAGTEILDVYASEVHNYNGTGPSFVTPAVELTNASFCNVTVSYTHPGRGDEASVEAWLPLEGWNNRLWGVGGGGFGAGRSVSSLPLLVIALSEGFASITTDGGVNPQGDLSLWAITSPGNVDWTNLENFAGATLGEQADFGKSFVKDFYGEDLDYSYFVGCSQGGRQALKVAQDYPEAYDGIIAAAPAINWNELLMTVHYPQQIMHELGEYPAPCELDAIARAAVDACDGQDGVVDGLVSKPAECLDTFDAYCMVGKIVKCPQLNGTEIKISKAAATVANAAWHGITTPDGRNLWHGYTPGTDISGTDSRYLGGVGSAMTSCNETGCASLPALGFEWINWFLFKGDTSRKLETLSRSEFIDLLHQSIKEYEAVIGTNNPDLSKFRAAGGKMITHHGTMDPLIPVKSTEQYYNAVTALDPDVHDFYRFYKAPGVGHCFGGPSSSPEILFRQLQEWVEGGEAPEETPVQVKTPSGEVHDRIWCPYPAAARFDEECGDAADRACWWCGESSNGER